MKRKDNKKEKIAATTKNSVKTKRKFPKIAN